MNSTGAFLLAIGQCLASMALYAPAHPVRVGARDRALVALLQMLSERGSTRFSFLSGDVIVGTRLMRELPAWDWGIKLSRAGVERLELDATPAPTSQDLDQLLMALHERASAPVDTRFPAFAHRGLRAGPLSVHAADALRAEGGNGFAVVDLLDALAGDSLDEEMEAVRWIHDEVANARDVPMAEVEAVVHALAAALNRDQQVVLPLLELKELDQYTTTHSCNVAMLSMGLAEQLGLGSADVRAIGTAALLHDIGKARISPELLTKPGPLTPAERDEMRRHPVEGARILSARGRGHGLAAIVAYEHHIWLNGQGGYPIFHYPRRCHFASRLVHVCDLYDALGTRRPYREAWSRDRALAHLRTRAGIEVDAEMVEAFAALASRASGLEPAERIA